jgi:chemotaxis protein methyltransferase CheR
LIIREMLPDYQDWSVEILATDISLAALATANRAIYARRQLRELDEAHIEKYFTAIGNGDFQLNPGLRGNIKFQASNLGEAAFGGAARPQAEFDLVVCRNVLIYFNADVQRRVAAHLAASVASQGCLAVAPAEASADWFPTLTPVNAPEAILFFRYPKAAEAWAPKSKPQAAAIGAVTVTPAAPIPGAPLPRREPVAPKRDTAAEIAELRALADRGLLAEARRRCQALLAEDQLNSGASLLLTEICVELEDLDSASAAARQTVFLSPQSAVAYYLLGTILAKQGETLKARRAMNTALSLAGEVPLETPTSVNSESTHGHIQRGAAAFLDPQATRRRRPKHDRA